MDNNVLIALIGAGSSGLVAITALFLNIAVFPRSTQGSFPSKARVAGFEARVDSRLNVMRTDMRDLNKTMTALEVDVTLVRDKVGL
jgi:voltage-gated potassium channel Kch